MDEDSDNLPLPRTEWLLACREDDPLMTEADADAAFDATPLTTRLLSLQVGQRAFSRLSESGAPLAARSHAQAILTGHETGKRYRNTGTTLDATEGSFACYLTQQERDALLAPHEHRLVKAQSHAEGCFGPTTVSLLLLLTGGLVGLVLTAFRHINTTGS